MDATCDWNSPGADPYRGTIAAAVARYNLPAPVRRELAAKAARVQFDAVVAITRDGIESRDGKFSNLRDMHWGAGRVCRGPVLRLKWDVGHVERALVYCSRGHCIAVPFVCRNVSLITMDRGTVAPAPEDPPPLLPPEAKVHTLPEPSTFLLAVGALPLLGWLRRNCLPAK